MHGRRRGEDEGVEARRALWRAVRIVAIADIVMSLDNVIAIAASAERPRRKSTRACPTVKATLIVFGLATSVPLIVAGSAILMALLERYRVLVWGGGALLGWIAGDVMATDPVTKDTSSPVGPKFPYLMLLLPWSAPFWCWWWAACGAGRSRPHTPRRCGRRSSHLT